MDKNLFAELTESMTQMGEIIRGERAPSREFTVDAVKLKEVRSATGLSQEHVEPVASSPEITAGRIHPNRRVVSAVSQHRTG